MQAVPQLAIDTSVCVHRDDLPEQSGTLLGAAVSLRVLRRLDDGSARSAIVTLSPQWRAESDVIISGTTQLFVLDGALQIGDQQLGEAGFAMLPAGTTALPVSSDVGATLIAIFDLRSAPTDRPPVVIEDVYTIPPFTPIIDGRLLDGFERRVLWIDPETKADTRFLRVPAGFRGAGPNWHPVQEEIFCLDGDIQPDDTRPMRAGSFLWNPARSIHGFDEHTVGGCLLLEWHDGDWALTPAPDAVRPSA
ncbi:MULTISPECIES: DUF4437 domain-containing protein [Sphingosinicellaceae]|uniref:DUF4437 domain-containing protein n=1 Tax=Sphingosinicellaceae TaxID=2820280 RepID=UPI001C1DE4F0|nr:MULTISPECIES: DUF4437 domain-containing protein [Polymorphobacter]QYE33944.1 DUF4437 domain-containing protein [Polymorphobacter sp. PAMC 29334]UAJ09114.1 DUF4437 domain-containing protein [Polymorphobacter megasporae]